MVKNYRTTFDACDNNSNDINAEISEKFNDDFFLIRTLCLPDEKITMMYYLQTEKENLSSSDQNIRNMMIEQTAYLCTNETTRSVMTYMNYEYIMVDPSGNIIENLFVSEDLCKKI